ncbi:MAG: ADP-glucose pyrophosphorylase [Clostridiales bacterium]|jgi:glucose-1-phosphate adenylyltransferase|nr:ADP-glucose pyrophosphorylase [Clostridiales bacterium]
MRALGVIFAGKGNDELQGLTNKRAVAAMPIAGKYRAIDFALSNMTNSHIQNVAIITQNNARSLIEHVNSSKWWDFGRKQGGLFVFSSATLGDSSYFYSGTADMLYQNIEYLKKSHEPYVILTSGDSVYKMDYNKLLEYHISKKADITIVCKDIGSSDNPTRFGVVEVDSDNKIIQFEEKPLETENTYVSTGIYVIRRRQLIDMLEELSADKRQDIATSIVMRYLKKKRMYAYDMKDYWKNISSVEAYYEANMDFLNKDIRNHFFKDDPIIYSKVYDLPPAKYNVGSAVKNSLISSGSIINGTVENSILFKTVFVGEGSVIKNSIILDDVYVGKDVIIENCIIESRDTLRDKSIYVENGRNINVIIEKNERYIM